MTVVFIILAIVVVLALVVVGMYNSLVHVKLRVDNAWAQIDTQLKRRFDLIPNLVEVVKGYATHEKDTLEAVIAARSAYTSASTETDKANADNQLSNCLKSIFALSESYPDLKANENFASLQTELSNTEDKIAYSRQFFNDAVQIYNTQIMIFPKNIIAGMFGFKSKNFFEVTDAEQRETVKVQF